MKRSISIVSLLFSALILTSCSMGSMMFHEQKSPYDFDKTVATIQANAKAQGWVVPKVYDFQKSLLKANQPDPGKITVLKLCHPEIAAKMLAKDDTKFVSVCSRRSAVDVDLDHFFVESIVGGDGPSAK